MLSPDQIETIANRTAELMAGKKRVYWVEPETHADDHEWVGAQRKREADFVELRQKVLTSACIWAVPIILAFALSAFWRELLRIAKN